MRCGEPFLEALILFSIVPYQTAGSLTSVRADALWWHDHLETVKAPTVSLEQILQVTRMCSLAAECVRLLQNVFSYYRMCSLTVECVHLLQNVFCYSRMCSLTVECVLLL